MWSHGSLFIQWPLQRSLQSNPNCPDGHSNSTVEFDKSQNALIRQNVNSQPSYGILKLNMYVHEIVQLPSLQLRLVYPGSQPLSQ